MIITTRMFKYGTNTRHLWTLLNTYHSGTKCRHTMTSCNINMVRFSIHLHTINCKLKMNVYWTHGVSMCGHARTLFHRCDTLLGPCVCSSGASRIHDYEMPFHRFHSRIQQQDGMLTLQPIVYFALSIRALKERQSGMNIQDKNSALKLVFECNSLMIQICPHVVNTIFQRLWQELQICKHI
jgi:hypothetical protein